jgi:chromosome segregation ATPase
MSSRSQSKEPTLNLRQALEKQEQAEAQLQHLKNELTSIGLKKQRAEEALAVHLKEIEARKARATKEYDKEQTRYELDIAAYPNVLKDLEDQKQSVMQSIADAIGELKLLQGNIETQTALLEKTQERKKLLDEQIEEAENDLSDLEEAIDDKADELKDIDNKLGVGIGRQADLWEAINTAENSLNDLRADLLTRKNAIEDDMKVIIQKSTDVVKRLIDLEQKEAKINNDINTRTKAIELREQVLNRRESKISGLEQKAHEYAKFMKL